MHGRAFDAILVLAGGLFFPSAVSACPVCDSGTGQAVRAGIFGSDFGFNLFVTIVPFLIFGVIVAGIYYGSPGEWRRRTRRVRVSEASGADS